MVKLGTKRAALATNRMYLTTFNTPPFTSPNRNTHRQKSMFIAPRIYKKTNDVNTLKLIKAKFFVCLTM